MGPQTLALIAEFGKRDLQQHRYSGETLTASQPESMNGLLIYHGGETFPQRSFVLDMLGAILLAQLGERFPKSELECYSARQSHRS